MNVVQCNQIIPMRLLFYQKQVSIKMFLNSKRYTPFLITMTYSSNMYLLEMPERTVGFGIYFHDHHTYFASLTQYSFNNNH